MSPAWIRSGARQRFTYNAKGEVLKKIEGNGRTTQNTYDNVGMKLTTTDPNGNVTTNGYDTAARITSVTDPLNRVRAYQYDLNNHLINATNRRGQVAAYTYDSMQRLSTETFADAKVTRTYDSSGRLINVVDTQGGTFSYSYDLAGRVLKAISPNGTIAYTRDANGRVMTRSVNGTNTVTYAYDAAGNLTSAALGAANVTRTYDQRNLLVSNARSNGVAGTYTFDAVGRILTMSEKTGSTPIFSRTFTYDGAGEIIDNAVDMGLPLSTAAATGTFDADNEVTAFGSTTYTSDADGHRLTEVGASGNTTYTWDARGRVLQGSTAPGGGIASTFVYDFAGNMIQKRVISSGSDSLQHYILDDLSNISWRCTSGEGDSSVISILDGRKPDDIIAVVQGTTTVFPLVDQVLSQAAVTDGSGNVVGREFYEPYGAGTVSGTTSLFQFTGKLPVNANLYYDHARFYDSTTGRFLSEDPKGAQGGDANLYRYSANNPISFADPTGNKKCSSFFARLSGCWLQDS